MKLNILLCSLILDLILTFSLAHANDNAKASIFADRTEALNQIKELKTTLEKCHVIEPSPDQTIYQEANEVISKTRTCYHNIYHQMVEYFYSNKKTKVDNLLSDVFAATDKYYKAIYLDYNGCDQACGHWWPYAAALDANEIAYKMLSQSLITLESKL